MKSIITAILLAVAFTASAQSPKGAEQLRSTKAPVENNSNVDGKFTILSSHIKSLGKIGRTGRYEIVSAKLRGLDSPNVSALLAYDSENDVLAVLSSGTAPGLGVAIVNGAATVGGSYLFGSKIRPDRTSVNNDGGNAYAESESDASAVAVSTSTSSNTNTNTKPGKGPKPPKPPKHGHGNN